MVVVVAGCSIANPTSSEVSLQYGSGPFDSRKFVECETDRDVSDVNDDHYYYPSGQRDDAAPTDGGEQMLEGWSALLRNYVGAAMDRATDNEALKYPWQKLYTDAPSKAQWERDVLAQLPKTLKTLTQGVDLMTINSVLLQKPGIQPDLMQGLTAKQAAELRSEAAEVDKEAAANFPGGIPGYQAYQQQQAINEAIKSGKVQVLPVPQGSPVIVSPTK